MCGVKFRSFGRITEESARTCDAAGRSGTFELNKEMTVLIARGSGPESRRIL